MGVLHSIQTLSSIKGVWRTPGGLKPCQRGVRIRSIECGFTKFYSLSGAKSRSRPNGPGQALGWDRSSRAGEAAIQARGGEAVK